MPFRGRGNTGEHAGWADQHLTGFGRFLRQAREYKGVSLRDVERKTRIPRRHLHALETEEFDQLPPLIYARGIVRNYAQYLGVDPMDALARFEQSHGQRSGGFQVVPAVKTTEVPSHWAPNFAIIAFMVIMSAVIFAWMYSAYFAPPENGAPTEQAVQTPEADQEVAVMDEEEEDGELAEGGGEALLPLQNELQDGESDEADVADDRDDPEQPSISVSPGNSGDEPESNDATVSQPVDSPNMHIFTISSTQRVWIQATVDGEIVMDDVLEPGTSRTFEGESMFLESGNAPYVNVRVDGENRGTLGDVWDSTNSYP